MSLVGASSKCTSGCIRVGLGGFDLRPTSLNSIALSSGTVRCSLGASLDSSSSSSPPSKGTDVSFGLVMSGVHLPINLRLRSTAAMLATIGRHLARKNIMLASAMGRGTICPCFTSSLHCWTMVRSRDSLRKPHCRTFRRFRSCSMHIGYWHSAQGIFQVAEE